MATVSLSNPLAVVIEIEKRAREALAVDELKFIIVNETYNLVSYHQAVLFDQFGKILTISGVANFDRNSPFVHWLMGYIAPFINGIEEPRQIVPENLKGDGSTEWPEWLASFGLVYPIMSPAHGKLGFLFITRDSLWSNDECKLLEIIIGTYGHCWGSFRKHKFFVGLNRRSFLIKIILLTIILCACFVPVPLTVLAPSEIVAVSPSVMRAPVRGVVEKVLVKPNQIIKKGNQLFLMDSLAQRNDLEVAKKIFKSLKVQYAQLTRRALSDADSKRSIAETIGKIKEQEIRIENLESLILRMTVLAPMAGIVVIEDPVSFEGRPVNLGEKILSLVDQKLVEVEAWLSVSDVIDLPEKANLRLYLNSNPLEPISADIHTFSYVAQLRPGDVLAHRVRAKILDIKVLPRLGHRGVSRISGHDVPVIYWALRRPIIALRQYIGW